MEQLSIFAIEKFKKNKKKIYSYKYRENDKKKKPPTTTNKNKTEKCFLIPFNTIVFSLQYTNIYI